METLQHKGPKEGAEKNNFKTSFHVQYVSLLLGSPEGWVTSAFPSRVSPRTCSKIMFMLMRVHGDTVLNKGWNRYAMFINLSEYLSLGIHQTYPPHPHTSLLTLSYLPCFLLPFFPSFVLSFLPSLLPSVLSNQHNWFHITCRIESPSLAWHSRLSGIWLHSVLSLYLPWFSQPSSAAKWTAFNFLNR